ncbi:MAG: aldo/keto reductase [Deinococcus sp.]|nr:aldo/keto reductase [Deinococcus sp.]
MEYRHLGSTGLKVSELCLGGMTLGRESDEDTSRRIIDRFLEAGGNFLDTANVYTQGRSEEIVGRALKGRRDRVVLASKVRFPMGTGPNDVGLSRAHIMSAIEQSLRRLQTDYLDLYQVHAWDHETPLEETLAALDDLVHQGKVRYLGVSNFTAWQLMKALGLSRQHGWNEFVSLQPQYSLVVRDMERELLPLCRTEGLAVLPWGPLGGGFLSGKYQPGEKPKEGRIAQAGDHWEEAWQRRGTERNFCILEVVRQISQARQKTCAQVALRWLLDQPGVTAPITGARTVEQLVDNLGASGWALSTEELQRLDQVSALEEEYPYRFLKLARTRR